MPVPSKLTQAFAVLFATLSASVAEVESVLKVTELAGGVSTKELGKRISSVKSGSLINASFLFKCPFNNGTYFLNAGVLGERGGEEVFLHRVLDLCMFKIDVNVLSPKTGIIDIEPLFNYQFKVTP